jgi:hypothetical protein
VKDEDLAPEDGWRNVVHSLQVRPLERSGPMRTLVLGTARSEAGGVHIGVASNRSISDVGHRHFRWMRAGAYDTLEWEPNGLTAAPTPTAVPTPSVSPPALEGVMPEGWSIQPASRIEHPWLYPEDGLEPGWTPILWATDGDSDCALVDATAYADELIFWGIADALEWELSGFEEEPSLGILPRITRDTSLLRPTVFDGQVLDGVLEETGFVDVGAEGELERTYILAEGPRWAYLTCRSAHPPQDRWMSVAERLRERPLEAALDQAAIPASRPLPSPSSTPPPSDAEAGLRDLAPLRDCQSRDAGNMPGAVAAITCTTPGDVRVAYIRFGDLEALEAWYRRQVGSVETTEHDDGFELCAEGQAVEGDWHLEDRPHIRGRVVCKLGTSIMRPSITWTDEGSRIGVRATSRELGMEGLYQRWYDGDYDLTSY